MVRIEIRERPLYEVANAFGINSMELLSIARDELKLTVKSHMSTVTGSDYEKLIKHLENKKSKGKRTALVEKPSDESADKPRVLRRKVVIRKVKETPAGDAPPVESENKVDLSPESTADTTETSTTASQAVETEANMTAAPQESVVTNSKGQKPKSAVVISRPDPATVQKRAAASKTKQGEGSDSGSDAKKGKRKQSQDFERTTRDPSDKKTPTSLVQKTEVFRPVDYLKREHIFRAKRKRMRGGLTGTNARTLPSVDKRVLVFERNLSVKDVAHRLSVKTYDVLSKLKGLGLEEINSNTVLDVETTTLVAHEFEYRVEDQQFTEDRFFENLDSAAKDPGLQEKAPVVTVMGHVDHGKTSILDAIRKTDVLKNEAGGITQHIGAYQVHHKNHPVSFIDTPGHAAFTAMRKRGASVTDIVVLVVAADDGVMPQTVEAIGHAKAAEVPIIVAVNKMDAPSANPEKIRTQLSEHNIISEEWGGDAIFVPTSALKGEGISELLDAILLVSEVAEIRAPFNVHPSGVVIESRLDKFLGPLATLVVTQGTMRQGDRVAAGTISGRIRQMRNEHGDATKEAVPGTPIEISGFDKVVTAGAKVDTLPKDSDIQMLLDYRNDRIFDDQQEERVAAEPTIEDLMSQVGENLEVGKLNVVVKSDVKGSEEALLSSIEALATDDGRSVNIVYAGCGTLSESDLDLVKTTESTLVLFHLPLPGSMERKLEKSGVTCIQSKVIYEIIERLEKMLEAQKEPEMVEEQLGEAEVRQVFSFSKSGIIAGCYMKDGKVNRNAYLRIVRDGNELLKTHIASLKRFKDDVKEVATGYECGIGLDLNKGDVIEGDIIRFFHEVEKKD